MGLAGSTLPLVKEWLVSLSPKELDDWVAKVKAGTADPVTLRVKYDNTKYVDYVFPIFNADGEIDTTKIKVTTDEEGNVYWEQICAIAPGMMLSKAKAVAEGIDISKYTIVTLDGAEYVLLERGMITRSRRSVETTCTLSSAPRPITPC